MGVFQSNAYSIINDVLVKIFKFFFVLYIMAISLIALDWFISTAPATWKIAMYAIVYWNKVESNGEPSLRLKARLDTALALFNAKKVERIIVSGWIGETGFNEAEVMRNYLLDKWVKIPWIIVDSEWYTTMDTSHNVFNINRIRWNYSNVWVIGVSQFYHISRIKLSLKRSWFKYIWSASPEYFEWRDIYSLVREVPAYVKYMFMWLSDEINIDADDLKVISDKVVQKITDKETYEFNSAAENQY